jgi:hypothetical protein
MDFVIVALAALANFVMHVGLTITTAVGLFLLGAELVLLTLVFAVVLFSPSWIGRISERLLQPIPLLVLFLICGLSYAVFMILVRDALDFSTWNTFEKAMGTFGGWLLLGLFCVGGYFVIRNWKGSKAKRQP